MPLRIAVIGFGHMGRLHAAKVAALRAGGADVTLSGVADSDPGRAREGAALYGLPTTVDYRELLGASDAALVVVPTERHFAVVRDSLLAGLDVLVEKPLAATVAEGEALLDLARRRGRVLQVGHQERFNAALRVIRGRIEKPRFIEAQRVGPFTERGTDVDVIRDLMIHDLDLLQQILGEEPARIEAIGLPVLSEHVDVANARVSFPCGCVASLTASRVSTTRVRKLRVFQPDGYLSLDFLAQTALAYRRPHRRDGAPGPLRVEKLALEVGDALLAQLRAFVDGVASRAPRGVGGDEALGALRTALRVVAAIPSVGSP